MTPLFPAPLLSTMDPSIRQLLLSLKAVEDQEEGAKGVDEELQGEAREVNQEEA